MSVDLQEEDLSGTCSESSHITWHNPTSNYTQSVHTTYLYDFQECNSTMQVVFET